MAEAALSALASREAPPAAQEPVEPTALRYVPTITSDRTNPETLGRGSIAARPQRWLQSMLADAERDMRQRAADAVYQRHTGVCTENVAHTLAQAIIALPLKHADREGGV